MASARFIKSINDNIAYLRTQTKDLADDTIATLDAEYKNILQAVKFGSGLPQTSAATAELVLQSEYVA